MGGGGGGGGHIEKTAGIPHWGTSATRIQAHPSGPTIRRHPHHGLSDCHMGTTQTDGEVQIDVEEKSKGDERNDKQDKYVCVGSDDDFDVCIDLFIDNNGAGIKTSRHKTQTHAHHTYSYSIKNTSNSHEH